MKLVHERVNSTAVIVFFIVCVIFAAFFFRPKEKWSHENRAELATRIESLLNDSFEVHVND